MQRERSEFRHTRRSAWIAAVAVDAIFNDICTHYLAIYVVDNALVTAQRVAHERASRAADELRSYDVARKVLQAGPTTPERQEELRLREDAARAAVGTEAEYQKFESLKSLAGAEMRRIHRLYYCIKLRCMVMPTRFMFLKSVASMDSNARQPVPAQFDLQGQSSTSSRAEDTGWAYFEWLYSESEKVRESFIQTVSDAVNDFNMATWPKDLGLGARQYPVTLWRGAARATVVRASTDVAIGEILEHTNHSVSFFNLSSVFTITIFNN